MADAPRPQKLRLVPPEVPWAAETPRLRVTGESLAKLLIVAFILMAFVFGALAVRALAGPGWMFAWLAGCCALVALILAQGLKTDG